MLSRNGWGPVSMAIETKAQERFNDQKFEPSSPTRRRGLAVRAELSGSNVARARGITARSPTPILALCHQLIAAGIDPAIPLHAYRGSTLALIVRIGEGARLEVNNKGTGFVRHRAVRAAPLVRQNDRGVS